MSHMEKVEKNREEQPIKLSYKEAQQLAFAK